MWRERVNAYKTWIEWWSNRQAANVLHLHERIIHIYIASVFHLCYLLWVRDDVSYIDSATRKNMFISLKIRDKKRRDHELNNKYYSWNKMYLWYFTTLETTLIPCSVLNIDTTFNIHTAPWIGLKKFQNSWLIILYKKRWVANWIIASHGFHQFTC
jgi:hypothetical protein